MRHWRHCINNVLQNGVPEDLAAAKGIGQQATRSYPQRTLPRRIASRVVVAARRGELKAERTRLVVKQLVEACGELLRASVGDAPGLSPGARNTGVRVEPSVLVGCGLQRAVADQLVE